MKNTISRIVMIFLFIGVINYAQKNEEIVKTFSATSGENLEINVDPGNIDIDTWNKDEVKIEVVAKKKYKVESLVAEKSGNTIKFLLELDDGWNNSVTIKVKAPSNFNFDLETTGGNINVGDNISGILTAETEGGNVNFKNVQGKVLVETSGGNISGNNVDGDVQLHSNGGNISLGNVQSGTSDVNTYGGNITVGNVTSDLKAKTHGGNLSIGSVGGNANVFTYGGHISMETVSGSANMETYGGHLSLEGASGNVVAKTMGGHISLENITGSIEAVTLGGHVTAELDPDKNTNSFLETSGGNMSLDIPASAKATIEVFIDNDDIEDEDPKEILESEFESEKFDVDKREGEIKAIYKLNGGGAKIKMNCVGGKVKINKWNK